jgi:hypothetical protein
MESRAEKMDDVWPVRNYIREMLVPKGSSGISIFIVPQLLGMGF